MPDRGQMEAMKRQAVRQVDSRLVRFAFPSVRGNNEGERLASWSLRLALVVFLSGAASAQAAEIKIGWLGLEGDGLAGLKLALADDNASGRFLGQTYALDSMTLSAKDDPAAALARLASSGIRFVVVDLPAETLIKLADSPPAKGLVILNAGAAEDSLRNAQCRRNVLHTIPSRAMSADALAQVLVRRNWKRWGMLVGSAPADSLYAEALRRAARKFGAKLVAEKPWTYTRDAQRTAEGEIALLTRDWSVDVVMVADEANEFGDSVPYNTFDPRPVAGTQGLTASAWHPTHDQWGATQLQNRFQALAHHPMTEKDFAAWAAGRAVGEAAMRARSAEPAKIEAAMRAEDFALAVFKGRAAAFRPWDGQLRQPILVNWARAVVTTAPQEGFLHPVTDLDTLGTDKGESTCVPR